jgi:hypothetical protein
MDTLKVLLRGDELLHYLEGLDQSAAHVLKYQFINQANNPPFIVAVEKRA